MEIQQIILWRTYEGISLIVVNFIAFALAKGALAADLKLSGLKSWYRDPYPELQELMSLVKTRKDHVTLIIAKKVASSNPLISFCPAWIVNLLHN